MNYKENNWWIHDKGVEFRIFVLSLRMLYKAVLHPQGKTKRELKPVCLCIIIPTLSNEFLKGKSPWERRPAHILTCPSAVYYFIPEIFAYMIPVHQKHHKWNSSVCSFTAVFPVLEREIRTAEL